MASDASAALSWSQASASRTAHGSNPASPSRPATASRSMKWSHPLEWLSSCSGVRPSCTRRTVVPPSAGSSVTVTVDVPGDSASSPSQPHV